MQGVNDALRYIENIVYNTSSLTAKQLSIVKLNALELIKPVNDKVISQYEDLAKYEAAFNVKTLAKIVKLNPLTDKQAVKAISKRNFTTRLNGQPNTISNAYDDFSLLRTNELVRAVRDGQTKQEEPSLIMAGLKTLALGLIANQAYSLARTSLSHIVTNVRQDTMAKNSIDRWRWVATLDNTCPYCESRHNEIFEEGDEEPPAHVNCNCIAVPIINDN